MYFTRSEDRFGDAVLESASLKLRFLVNVAMRQIFQESYNHESDMVTDQLEVGRAYVCAAAAVLVSLDPDTNQARSFEWLSKVGKSDETSDEFPISFSEGLSNVRTIIRSAAVSMARLQTEIWNKAAEDDNPGFGTEYIIEYAKSSMRSECKHSKEGTLNLCSARASLLAWVLLRLVIEGVPTVETLKTQFPDDGPYIYSRTLEVCGKELQPLGAVVAGFDYGAIVNQLKCSEEGHS